MADPIQALVVSDFNVDTFAAYLENDAESPQIEPTVAPFGQVVQTLVGSSSWDPALQFAVVWTQPQAVVPSFHAALQFQKVDTNRVLAEVEEFARLLLQAADKVATLFIPTWEIPPAQQGYGLLEMKPGTGITSLLMQMNLKLAEAVSAKPNIFVLPAGKWIAAVGKNAFNPKLWYMTKAPFSNDVFKEAIRDIKASLRGLRGESRKLVVVDLDDTLWGGIVGDAGWQNLKLGGHDPLGEAYVDFQTALKSLTNRGILLGIVSKNTESVALEAIENHPAMVLKRDDFAHVKINWDDKAKNVAELAADLNLGLQSVVFIDDNPVERARVRDALPEVLVPEWPQDKTLYKSALLALNCFNQPVLTSEDARRGQMYRDEERREQLKTEVGSIDDWLKSLGMEVTVEPLQPANLARAAQLLNKTNQMNLSTRRMTEAELQQWAAQPGHQLWTVNVSDKFGDSGLTGIISVSEHASVIHIEDFILSCRVMGRKVEEAMVHVATQFATSRGASRIEARYLKTAKNQPCYDFWKKSGFQSESEGTFVWNPATDYAAPTSIRLTLK